MIGKKGIVAVVIAAVVIGSVSFAFLAGIINVSVNKNGTVAGGTVYLIEGRLTTGMRPTSLLSVDVISSDPSCNRIRLQFDSALPSGFQEGDTVVIRGTISDSTLHVISIWK